MHRSTVVVPTKKRKLAVCLVSSHRVFEAVGGVEVFTKNLCASLQRKGVHTRILCRSLDFPINIKSSENCETSQNLKRKIPSETRKNSTFLYLVSMVFFSLFLFLGILREYTQRGIDVIHAQDPVFSGLPSVLASRIMNIPLIVHCHGSMAQPHRHKPRGFMWAFERLFYTLTIKSNPVFILTDSTTARYVREDGLDQERTRIIPAFVDLAMFYEKPRQGISNDGEAFIVGFVGRLTHVKRVDLLLKAVTQLNEAGMNVRALIVGDGESRKDLESLSLELGIGNQVDFIGWMRNVHSYLQRMDVFVLPSESEGSPLSLMEAMATGLPSIVSNLISMRALVGEDCVQFFKRGDSTDLARVLRELVADAELRNQMSECSLKRVRAFGIDRVDSIIREYRMLVDTKDSVESRD